MSGIDPFGEGYRIIVVAAVLINSVILGGVSLHFLTVDDADINNVPWPWVEQKETTTIPKADSDFIYINGEKVPWPDKISDMEEQYIYGTDMFDPDSDQDGMEDGWEVFHMTTINIFYPISSPDPLKKDAFDNYDGDGFDENGNGVLEGSEKLFNLREYVGGVEYDTEMGCFDPMDPVFGGLDPGKDWREIGRLGGWHMLDCKAINMKYNTYNPFQREQLIPLTLDPSRSDTDGDGIEDGWEIHYARELKERFFDENISIFEAEPTQHPLIFDLSKEAGMYNMTIPSPINRPGTLIDPLVPTDADRDMDLRRVHTNGFDEKDIWILHPDGMSNLDEYLNGTSPILWDTDGDSFYNPVNKEFFDLSDSV
ncbi:MAG: hypothetical protein U9R75_10825, partial [Candidatus Thermoplasmatota archaeon]|nr:hypothetical protein [Candidatus Thermoplasmatota archaeon]